MNSNSPIAKPSFSWMIRSINRIFAFGFGSGLSTVAPGTAGTLWAWALFLIAEQFIGYGVMLWIIAIGFVLGCWICGQVSEELGEKDFGGIVWDEMIAFWLILFFIMPASLWMQVLTFALFRFFDAVKPGPIGMIDRHFKNLEYSDVPSNKTQILWRGFGIMVDDLAAAIFTLALIAAIQIIAIQMAWV